MPAAESGVRAAYQLLEDTSTT